MTRLQIGAAVALVLAAGSAQGGDFGRADPPLFEITRPGFNDTDEEREMQDRIWRFLHPPHEFRIDRKHPQASYYLWLSRTSYASSRTRYSTMADDIDADLGTLPDTFAAICRVEDVDRQRHVALAGLPGLEAQMGERVAQRSAQNDADIAAFAGGLNWRFVAYSYALDHLLVETPHEGAVTVDGRLGELEHYLKRAERRDFCAAASHQQPPPSRYDQTAPVDLELPGS